MGATLGGALYVAVAVPFAQLSRTLDDLVIALRHRYARGSARRAPSP